MEAIYASMMSMSLKAMRCVHEGHLCTVMLNMSPCWCQRGCEEGSGGGERERAGGGGGGWVKRRNCARRGIEMVGKGAVREGGSVNCGSV